MTEQEQFESIAAQLRADRGWVRRILWLRAANWLTSFGNDALASMVLISIYWVP
jgi:hypothetical protein